MKFTKETHDTKVNYSLNWKGTPTSINQSAPTNKELIYTMEELRSGLSFCKYPLPYTYSRCRKEIAYVVAEELKKSDYTLIVKVLELKERLSFNPSMNCYVRYIIVAKHPKAMGYALRELKDDLLCSPE